ncbi:hypothetical protein CA85_30370 [Allorhodopirellula solitaria]|uniref:Outer membrane protein beta-barrel domain-containing protein n=2 Tax=Allorhodopirellula solitaria TaxID=2527987 RepID=A0A5C5XUV2_9BACT|nr:hypothetical protein CA85_30370 [Allorhodopirellula solitaria]
MRCNQNSWSLYGVVVMTLTGWLALGASPASAVDGTELNSSVGVWAPLLPSLGTSSGDSIGTIVGLGGHHRFDGYLTSVESNVRYGVTDTTQMINVDAIMRDTWDFGNHHLSAGFGYSMMNWDQDAGNESIDSDYQGAKIVAGWETVFGRTPIWLDLSLGLYDLNGRYSSGMIADEISDFATTYGIDLKTDVNVFGVPSRLVLGINYLDNFAAWQAGQIGTDDGVVLTGAIEFSLF